MTDQYIGQKPNGEKVYLSIRLEEKPGRAFQTVNHEPVGETYLEFAVMGHVTTARGRDLSAGQMVEEALEVTRFAPDWDAEKVATLVTLWREWHLNGITAGCAHQTPVYAPDQYGRNVPSLDLTPACPETGYRYGHAWLVRVLPDGVVAQVKTLLPTEVPA